LTGETRCNRLPVSDTKDVEVSRQPSFWYFLFMAKSGTATRSSGQFRSVFQWLRGIATAHATLASVGEDTPTLYTLIAEVGPETVRLRGVQAAGTTMPVVYLKVGKSYVSFHLLGLYMNPSLEGQISAELIKRKQGKTCFNFRKEDSDLTAELRDLTRKSIVALRSRGFIL
jgi:hypothetical protein